MWTRFPETLVVNIGAVLNWRRMAILRATVHRVVTPPPASRGFRSVFLKRGGNATMPLLSLPKELAAEARGPASGRGTVVPTCRLKSRPRSYADVARRCRSSGLRSEHESFPFRAFFGLSFVAKAVK
ncbi:hypothetical protein [Mesorhizobium sp. M0859]|uniref:hypothetical protein n=1 Tax=Mesorhizobium sp. M0859 TaxID=2957014 RepID=UPI00333AB16E